MWGVRDHLAAGSYGLCWGGTERRLCHFSVSECALLGLMIRGAGRAAYIHIKQSSKQAGRATNMPRGDQPRCVQVTLAQHIPAGEAAETPPSDGPSRRSCWAASLSPKLFYSARPLAVILVAGEVFIVFRQA